jgi:hypothetical protein
MKNILYAALVLAAFQSCNNNPNTRVLNDSASTSRTDVQNDSMSVCFQRYTGTTQQDTFTVHLVLRDGKVDGELVEMLYEKDARRGTLKGTVQDSVIHTVWSYIQEGQQATLQAAFKMKDGNLWQQVYSVDHKTGRQYLNDTNAFTILYTPLDCRKIPKQKS